VSAVADHWIVHGHFVIGAWWAPTGHSAGCRSSCSSLRSASFARSLTWCSLERPRSTAVEPARPESRRIPMGQGRAIIRVSIGDTGGWREYGIGAHRASVGIGGTTMKCKG
jgi:hypothetical protein